MTRRHALAFVALLSPTLAHAQPKPPPPQALYQQPGSWTAPQTFNNGLAVGSGAGAPVIAINGASGTNKGVNWLNAGTNRWRLLMDASNNMNLYAYDALGAFLDTAWNATQSNHTLNFNYQIATNNNYAPIAGGVAGSQFGTHNTGTNAAQGALFQYFSVAGSAGFDTGTTFISVFDPVFQNGVNPAEQGLWMVSICPNEPTKFFGCNISELNLVNRGPDAGWARDRASGNNPTGGLLFVPESSTFGQPGEGKNVTYAYSVSRSGANNSTGFPVKSYNGYLCEPDSIVGLTGRCLYMTGDITSTSSQRPYAPMQTDGTWLHGIDHTLATYIDNHAQTMMAAQSLAFISGTTASPTGTATVGATDNGSGNIDITLTPAGTGAVNATAPVKLTKASATGAAPGAGKLRLEVVAGTTGGTCKIIAYAGTSTTPTTVIDNVGTGC